MICFWFMRQFQLTQLRQPEGVPAIFFLRLLMMRFAPQVPG
jgi:hypothetical protein